MEGGTHFHCHVGEGSADIDTHPDQFAIYRHFLLNSQKDIPERDEYVVCCHGLVQARVYRFPQKALRVHVIGYWRLWMFRCVSPAPGNLMCWRYCLPVKSTPSSGVGSFRRS